MKGCLHLYATFCILLLTFSSVFGQQTGHLGKTTFAAKDIFQTAYFLENRNILPDDGQRKVLYFANHDHVCASFTETGILYHVTSVVENEEAEKDQVSNSGQEEQEQMPVKSSLVKMDWVGSNQQALITVGEKAPGYYTYLKQNGKGYNTLVTYGYKTIRYHDLYPGVDVEYSFPEQGGMEYTLFVAAGADVSKVKIQYTGATESITKDADGNIVIHTDAGDIVEHSPVSFSASGNKVSRFEQNANSIQFGFPEGYNTGEALTIDPWVNVITGTPADMSFDADYDFGGNLFAYGAGPSAATYLSDFYEITKFDINGNPLWTFNGSVPSASWNTTGGSGSVNYPSNIIVDKVTGKVYTGKGYDPNGTAVIRLNSYGIYDSFISNINSTFQETWGFAYRCSSGQILALGGGTSSNLNMGVIDTTTAVTTTSNVTGIASVIRQDIISGTYDTAGNLYVLLNCYTPTSLPYTNTIYKVNSSFNGNIWSANTGYTPFQEALNSPYWYGSGVGSSYNWFNALAANGSYLYYYDGYHLAAYNLTTGAVVGAPDSITGYSALYQGGIAVDNCNNVYVGGIGAIKTFSFNGTNFTAQADIALGAGFNTDTVHDIKYNSTNNLLYVTGGGFAGTYTASLSANCIVAATYTAATAVNCDTATVTITPGAGLSPLVFNYIWSDSTGSVISQLNSTADTANTLTGLQNGTYNVQIQWNSNCGGLAVSKTVVVDCSINGIDNVAGDLTAEVYPNPLVTGSWNLMVGNALIGSTAEIFDATGNKVHQFKIVNQRSVIDLNIAPGVYFMQINSSSYNFVRKLIRL